MDPIHIREMLAERDFYYCQCWTLTQESQFFWRAYGYDNTAVRIEVDLKDVFELGVRIEPVVYSDFLLKEDWTEEGKQYGQRFAKDDEADIFWVDEDGYYHGDFSKKTADMRYAQYVISVMYSMHEREFRFEKIPLPRIIATKQPKFAIENEVRLFLEAYPFPPKYDGDEYYVRHRDYVNRVYEKYDDKDETLDTHMPQLKSFSFSKNGGFIKSILCHPYMPDTTFEQIYEAVKRHNMLDIFKGRSSLFSLI